MSGIMALRHTFPGNKRCELCHKPKKALYQIEIDGYRIYVCSGICAETARHNWEEKKKLGARPGVPLPPKENPIEEAVGDNISNLEGGSQ